jgi:hypothetical protein
MGSQILCMRVADRSSPIVHECDLVPQEATITITITIS